MGVKIIMPKNARLTDLWAGFCTCCPAPMSGPIVTASPNVSVNNLGQARLTDVVIGFCGHAGFIVGASSDSYVNNLGIARLSDPVAGCTIGAIVTNSPDTTTNG